MTQAYKMTRPSVCVMAGGPWRAGADRVARSCRRWAG
jgi:hypothetical protein